MGEEGASGQGHAGVGGPRVTILIVNWNTRSLLLECLRSIRSGTTLTHEVIVIDNGSRDGSAEALRSTFPDVILIANPSNVGFARANEQGFRRARGEYVLLLNSDTAVGDGAIDRCVEFAERHPRAAAVGCRLTYPDGTFQPSCFRFPSLRGVCLASAGLPLLFPRSPLANWDGYGGRDWSQTQDVDFAVGSFLLLRSSAAQQVGFLDPRFFLYGEEADLCYRLRARGWRTLYDPRASVVHHRGGSAQDSRTRAWVYQAKQRAILFFLYKHHGALHAWLGNLAMLAGMPLRLVAWLTSDLIALSGAGRSSSGARLVKARMLLFHLAALCRPSCLRQAWDRTPVEDASFARGASRSEAS